MKLTVVGCSGSLPGPASAASCYLLEAPDGAGRVWRILLDLGSGALGPLQRYCDPRTLDAVLLSHLHPDHCLDLTGLYVLRRYHPGDGPIEPIRVWGPADVAARISAAYDPFGGQLSSAPDLSDQLSFRQWQPGEGIDVGPLHIVPVIVDHPVEAYGMRITWCRDRDAPPVVLGYSGDTDDCPGLDRIAADADLFLCEAGFVPGEAGVQGVHLTAREAGDVAARSGARQLLLTHIPPWHDPWQARAAAGEVFRGPIDLAVPGLVREL